MIPATLRGRLDKRWPLSIPVASPSLFQEPRPEVTMTRNARCHVIVSLAIGLAWSASAHCRADKPGEVRGFNLAWPEPKPDPAKPAINCPRTVSTHEIVYPKDGGAFWITGGHHDHIARVTLDGQAEFFSTGQNSEPHGIVSDGNDRLWVALERC